METKLTKFPCPKCGTYNEPYLVNSKGIAMMKCDTHGLYETSVDVSKDFRIFCSKVAKKHTRSQGYFTSGEKKIRKILLNLGLREGIDYMHNVRVKNGRTYYWLDFYFPKLDLSLPYNPKIWHSLWNRAESDKRKHKFLLDNGIKEISITNRNMNKIPEIIEDRRRELNEEKVLS